MKKNLIALFFLLPCLFMGAAYSQIPEITYSNGVTDNSVLPLPKTGSKQFSNSFSLKKEGVQGTLKTDSSSANFSSSANKKLVENKKGISNGLQKNKSFLQKTNGNVSLGYDYGVIPFIISKKFPAGYFKTEGNVGFEALKLPLVASFYFADVKTVSGLNNYFRISFDEKKYKENLQNERSERTDVAKEKLSKLYSNRQKLEQKLFYSKFIQSGEKFQGSTTRPELNNKLNQPYKTTFPGDSLSVSDYSKEPFYKNELKNGPNRNALSDSLVLENEYTHKADSLREKISEYEQQIKAAEKEITEVEKELKILENVNDVKGGSSLPNKGLESIFSYVKKLEIGLCYPNYSTFLINGCALKGINLEIQKRKLYFAFTYGKTINNLMMSNNVIQNNLEHTRNLYNFFDFKDVKESRRITAVKLGYGDKEETHLHAGILYGLGQSSYLVNAGESQNNEAAKERNYVVELDGKFVINRNNSIYAAYGKSSVQQEGVNYKDGEKGFGSIFNFNNRSNAALVKYASFIPKTSSKITLTSRWIDPFFRSYGLGFMRSDNFRYEVKLEQPITRRVKVGLSYRKDEDNLLNMYLIKTTLQTIGSSIMVRFNRQLTVRASFNPVLMQVHSRDNSVRFDNNNYISNFLVSWTPRLNKVTNSVNALYNYYRLYDGIRNDIYQNYSLTNVTTISEVKNELSINYFEGNNANDSISSAAFLVNDYVSFSLKRLMVTLGGKLSDSKQFGMQFGYKLKVIIPLSRNLSIEASGEKLVMGDFYNSFPADKLNGFPYYCYGKLIINW